MTDVFSPSYTHGEMTDVSSPSYTSAEMADAAPSWNTRVEMIEWDADFMCWSMSGMITWIENTYLALRRPVYSLKGMIN